MIKWVGGLLDRLLAVSGALLFSQAPLYMHHYQQQLSGHVNELIYQVDIMRQAASASGKSLAQFIRKFLESTDADFVRQGNIMNDMALRTQKLSDALSTLDSASIFSKPFLFLTHLDLKIAKASYQSFNIGIPLTYEGLTYALMGMGMGFLIFFTLKQLAFGFSHLIIPRKKGRTLQSDACIPDGV